MLKPRFLIAAVAAVVPVLLMSGCNVGQYEEPNYTVKQSKPEGIEIREYAPKIVAQVEVVGERDAAINAGFRMIADYIFGNNAPNAKIAMTAPVIQQEVKGQKIAMTAPVIQQGSGKPNTWIVQFVMPSEYTLETLPKPNNAAVKLLKTPPKKMAAIRFSGSSSPSNLTEHKDQLTDYIKTQKLNTTGAPLFAFYDPPWTLPFFRRNEIMFELVD